MRRILLFLMAAILCLCAEGAWAQKKGKKQAPAAATGDSVAPDKVLYDKGMNDIKHGKGEVGRLTMQTLINTYPDSDYLAKAKLAIGDSFYKEGGPANLTQAIASYKDFIVFFPFLPEAAYAQLRVGMAHYREMDKPDRDRREAHAAEDELQTFLRKYPNDPLAPDAEQRLREVQEVLAEGDFRVASYYYVKGSMLASASRLVAITNRYPLYSKSDQALWMLGSLFERSEHKDQAAIYYTRIVREYPLSDLTGRAKEKLTALGKPIPQADPQAVAWEKKEQSADRGSTGIIHKSMGMIRNGPDVHTASMYGKPNLEPETGYEGEVLNPGGGARTGGAPGGTAVIATVTAGNAPSGTAETVAPAGDTANAATSDPTATTPAPTPAGDAEGSSTPTPAAEPVASGDAAAAPAAQPAATPASSSDATASAAPADPTGQTPAAKPADATTAQPPADQQKESSSKKKKGLHKIIPW